MHKINFREKKKLNEFLLFFKNKFSNDLFVRCLVLVIERHISKEDPHWRYILVTK